MMTLLQNHVKVALRNLWKFKIQTVVCVLGLSVGMACFALGTLWLRYIESFEDFVPDAENTYFVGRGLDQHKGTLNYHTGFNEAQILREHFPEVTDACTFDCPSYKSDWEASTEKGTFYFPVATADTTFFRFFGIEPLQGSFANFGRGEIVLTKSQSEKMFGKESALGKTVKLKTKYSSEDTDFVVTAIIPDCPHNTQFRYEAVVNFYNEELKGTGFILYETLVRLNPRADLDSIVGRPFSLELHEQVAGNNYYIIDTHNYLIQPLRKLRTMFPGEQFLISTSYIRWFMLLGVLVILCSLVNYIITMVNHLRRRAWEMSLRRVLGASRKTILAMVSTETLLTFLVAAVVGVFWIFAVMPYFREYSNIDLPLSSIAARLFCYLALVIAASCALSAFVAWFVMEKTQGTILGARQLKHSSTALDRAGVILQLALSMGIIFSVSIMLRQVNYLMYSDDLGFTHNNIGVLQTDSEELRARVRQSPMIEEFVDHSDVIFPKYSNTRLSTMEMEVTADGDSVPKYESYDAVNLTDELARLYHLQPVAGRLPISDFYKNDVRMIERAGLDDGKFVTYEEAMFPHEVCVNEAYCRAKGFAPEAIIGYKFYSFWGQEYVIAGVLKDMYINGATIEPQPTIYRCKENLPRSPWGGEYDIDEPDYLVFRAKPGRLAEVCDSIKALNGELGHWMRVCDCEKEFNGYVKSEQMLIKILLAVALCSLFVCVLGAFSLVSLSLTERRKEIAIRKAHGAHISDILQLFLRSHYLSLAIAALVAYPLSYIIMRNWLEHYTKQVGVDWWIIPATFLLISLVVIATISLKIYLAAKEKAARALAG